MTLGNLVIFGDSYSTFTGYIPDGYSCYYIGPREADSPHATVRNVRLTWWWRLIEATGATLLENNSWSGSTIGYTGYNGRDCSGDSSFLVRLEEKVESGFFKDNAVDTVIVFGGTNDSWSGAPLGEIKYDGITREDLYCVLPAIGRLAARLCEVLPTARVIFLGNCGIKTAITEAMQDACHRYGHTYIGLTDIDKRGAHPTERGMEQIFHQIMEQLGDR